MIRAPASRTNRTASPVKGCTSTLLNSLTTPRNKLHALVDGEERRLVGVDADADDEPVEQLAAAPDDVEVPEVDRVERAGVDGDTRAQGDRA